MRKFSLTEKVLAGIGTVVAGILLFFGQKIGETILNMTLPTIPNQGLSLVDWVTIAVIAIGVLTIIYGVQAMRKLIPVSTSELDSVQQSYETAFFFKITSSTDWFGVGVVDSKDVKIDELRAPEETQLHFKGITDPNLSYFRVDQKKDSVMLVFARFDIHPGTPLIFFLRKGDKGNLKVEVSNKNRKHLGSHEYGRTNERWNYCEFKPKYK